MNERVHELLSRVRQNKPVVHHLTNWVTIYECAQIVKAIGGSPVMAHAPDEVADMVKIASALVLNIGTLTSDLIESMKAATRAANRKGIPVVLDVCGAGATPFRDEKAAELLDSVRIAIIKGNASEIARVAGGSASTRGVDAGEVHDDLLQLARSLAHKRQATVVVTGREDIVAGSDSVFIVRNGHEMMTSVVGTGCMAASVIGAFAAVETNLPLAAACALSAYGVAAELAAEKSLGPSSFKGNLLDCFHSLRREDILSRANISAP
jgi:hydroxyethylthiazole kinase